MFLTFCFFIGSLTCAWPQAAQTAPISTVKQRAEAQTAYYQGVSDTQDQKYDAALLAFQQAVRLNPEFAEAQFALGVIYQIQFNLKSASESFATAIRLRPNWLQPYLHKAEVDVRRGKAGEAETAALQAVQINPKSPEAHFWLGYARDTLGKEEDALQSYQQALRLRPQYAAAQTKMGHLHNFRKREAEAIAAYQLAIAADPKFGEAHDSLGHLYIRQKKFSLARAEVKILKDLEDPNAKLVEQELLRAERVDKAERAFAKRPNDALVLTELALALLDEQPMDMEERAHRARGLFAKVLRRQPNNAQAHYGLGLCAVALKEPHVAQSELTTLKRLNKRFALQLAEKIKDGSIHGRLPSIRILEK